MTEWTTLHDRAEIEAFERQGLWQSNTLWTLAERADPDHTAIVCPRHGAVSYGQMLEDAEGVAMAWVSEGLEPEQVVIVQVPNWYDFVLAHLALTRIGAVTLPALPNYREQEIKQLANGSGAVAIVGATSFRQSPSREFYESMSSRCESVETVWLVDDDPRGLRAVALDADRSVELPSHPHPDATTILIATSGTTGEPKLVMHSHRSTLGGVVGKIAEEVIGLDADDVVLMASPVTHMTGLQYGVRMTAWIGGTLVLMDRWDAAEAAKLIERHRVTYSQGATPFLFDLVNLPADDLKRLGTLRNFACGGAPIPPELAAKALEVIPGTSLLPTWGMSETAIVTLASPDDPPEKVTGSDGPPVPGWQARIVAPDGEVLPPGEEGEIESRGAGLFNGYLGRPDLTEAAMHDGWLRSGDRGRIDEDGYVRCLDRIKDLVIRGGLNVTPSEVENLVLLHPAVEQVAIVGIPDARLGERICAALIVRDGGVPPTVGELGAFLLEKGLSKQKLPERIVAFDEFPMTAAGKVQKFKLRELVLAAQEGDQG